jgi:hypothetical protein
MKYSLAALVAAAVPLLASLDAARPGLAQEKKVEPAKESRTAYVRRLYEKDVATYADGCRAILSVVTGEHTDADFAAVQKDLAGRGIVDPDWGRAESDKLTKGALAYMVVKTLGIKGGATMAIFGTTRRYALRECVYLRLMTGGTTDEYVSGRELIDVVTDVEQYRQGRGAGR